MIRNIEIVGEAASRLSPEFAARHAEIPWRDIVGMRHRLIHGYLKVNLDTVWEVVERDLPALAPKLRALLGESPAPPVKRAASKPRAARLQPPRGRVRRSVVAEDEAASVRRLRRRRGAPAVPVPPGRS